MSEDRRKTVLIVEDNDLNMRLFNDILQANGYHTLRDHDGRAALAMVEEHRPDLVLMDVRLPNRSGLDIMKEIKAREHLRHIPIVAITASAPKGGDQFYLDEGCDGFIAKPISIPAFLKEVAKFLD